MFLHRHCICSLCFSRLGNDDTISQSNIPCFIMFYRFLFNKVSAQTCEFEIEMYIGGMFLFVSLTGFLTNKITKLHCPGYT